ncbi:MAG TPA: o-succinylbenzoate synthase [Gemmatimonadaceae bacterium]|nr:o-succinylbenzoate synthase [Gemmatimonadaceae bacterium]
MSQDKTQLARITLREIRLPLVEPFRTATGTVEARRVILLELSDADGATAWSECVADAVPSYTPETVDGAWQALTDWIIPLVLDKSFAHPTDVHAALVSWVPDHPMARASVEMGTWALAATRRQESLARFLARSSDLGAPPRKSVATGIALGLTSNGTDMVNQVRLAAAEGYRRIKLKISPQSDLGPIREACAQVGAKAALSVDANGSFSTDDMTVLKEIDAMGLSMIEQPLDAKDFEGHAELQRSLRTPICLDESIESDATAERMVRLHSGRIVNMKAGRVGGFTEAVAIHDRCRLAEIPLWCGGMLESGIGRAYNVALASLPNFTLPGDISPSARYWARDIVTEPWTMDSEGMVMVPVERAGTGVDVDRAFVDELVVRESAFSAS